MGMVYIIPTQFPLAKASHMDKANITGQGEEQMLFPEDALSVTWPRTRTQNPHTLWLASCSHRPNVVCGLLCSAHGLRMFLYSLGVVKFKKKRERRIKVKEEEEEGKKRW